MIVADLLGSVGRLHPFVVHLPIGRLILALMLDVLSYREKQVNFSSAIKVLLLIGFIAAGAACLFGYILSLTVDYDADTLTRHMYSGLAVAFVSGLLYFVRTSKKVFSTSLLITAGLLSYAGHQGGKLTYGDEYLSFDAPVDRIEIKRLTEVELMLETDKTNVQNVRNKNINVRIILQRPLQLDVTIQPEAHVNFETLGSDLQAVAPNVIQFSAPGNNLKDDDLLFITSFKNLERLRLEKNPITDEAINHFIGLKHLTTVNLYNTKVTAAGVAKLKTNRSIQTVYAWGTKGE